MVDGITQQKLEEIGYGVSDHYEDGLAEYVWELEEIDGLKVPQIEARFTYVGDVFNENLLFDPNLGLNKVNVPDSTNLALYKVNFKSSN